jgi:CheY-like chemotaxis protein/PAS domain-containing protein
MFGVDLNLRCTFWNRRATDATGWSDTEVLGNLRFTATIFSNQKDGEKDCAELLKAALDGNDSVQEIWTLKTKWGSDMSVALIANAHTDSMGATCGVVCVIMPLSAPRLDQPSLRLDCNVSAMDHLSILDLEEDVNSYGSPREDSFLAALEQPPSPYFDGSVRDLYGDPTHTFYEPESSSMCSQDWCKSEQSPDASKALNSLERSSLTQARAMVVVPDARDRKSLNLMLERCGFEVSCASSGSEALWTFEQSMQDPEGFSIVFVNLDSARSDDYALIRHLRNMESRASGPNITTQVVIVAITHLNRWQDSTQRDISATQKDMSAGLDAIMNYPLRVQQLRDTLNSLGVQIDHLDFGNKTLRASFNSWNNPLILAR